MRQDIINNYKEKLQRDYSSEWLRVLEENEDKILKAPFWSKVENILEVDYTASAWISFWSKPNGKELRLYINCQNTKGYKYPIVNNYILC